MTEIVFNDAKCVSVSFVHPDHTYDKHRYTEQTEQDDGPYDDNAGILYDKVVIELIRPNWRITKYPKDRDAYETYKYLPVDRYIVNVISKEKCTNCKKHEEERDTTVKTNVPAVFVTK